MTMQRFCHRRADIAARLGIDYRDVGDDLTWDYEMGHMDDGATCTLWAPGYRLAPPTAPAVSALGAYTIYGGER